MASDAERLGEAEAHIRRAEALLLQAAAAVEHDREALYVEAYDALIRAESFAAGSASWRIARLCARQGRGDHCRRWLERAHRTGGLPDRATLESHGDLERVRSQPWFRRFLNGLP